MALDPSIPLSVARQPGLNPLAIMSAMSQMREQEQATAEAAAEREERKQAKLSAQQEASLKAVARAMLPIKGKPPDQRGAVFTPAVRALKAQGLLPPDFDEVYTPGNDDQWIDSMPSVLMTDAQRVEPYLPPKPASAASRFIELPDGTIWDSETKTDVRTGTPPATNRVWVYRNGQPVRVAETNIQPGDRPTDPSTGSGGAGFTLNPGDVRFDETGKELARLPPGPAGAGSRSWVLREGRPVRVSEAEIRPGDAPFNSARDDLRNVTSGDAGRIADFDTSLSDLGVLNEAITETESATGTVAAVGAALPAWVTDLAGWGTSAKSRQGVIDRVKQVIGKTLEGGVLRKEDEYKYEKILPTIKDTQAVAKTKLVGLETAIRQRRSTFLDALSDAGYDTTQYNARPSSPPLTASAPGMIRARDPQGVVHEAKAGTPLPKGWVQLP
jgi:hypothetical protein